MSLLNETQLAVAIMHDSLKRQLLAVSIIPNFLLNPLAESAKINSLINAPIILLDNYNLNFNDNHHSNYKLFTMVIESETTNPFTPIRRDDIEGEVLFHDTVRRDSDTNSVTSPVASVDHHSLSSELVPTTLVHSPVPSLVSISPTMATITIGGIAIAVEATEQVRTTTGGLYTKAI
jgi:hypothetical protein